MDMDHGASTFQLDLEKKSLEFQKKQEHPSIHQLDYLSYWVMRKIGTIPGDLGHKAGYTMDSMPGYHMAPLHPHSHTPDNLEMLISMWFHRAKKLKNLDNTQGTNKKCKFHTHTWQSPELNPQALMCKASVVTTKPLSGKKIFVEFHMNY